MNEEYKRGWRATAKIGVAVIVSTLWWLAGRGDILGFNFHRRFWLPLILALACIGFDLWQKKTSPDPLLGKRIYRNILYATMVPLYYISMSIFSYGTGSWLRPIFGPVLQRTVVGFMWAIPAFPAAYANEDMDVFFTHVLLFTFVMTALGAFGIVNASAEEAVIGFCFALLVPFMVKEA